MIAIETWKRNPEGTYDVTIFNTDNKKSYTYQFTSQPIIHRLEELIRHQRYKCAFALIAGYAISSSGQADNRRHTPSEGRVRPDPAGTKRAVTVSARPGALPAETGCLFEGPDASQSIAAAGNRSVMLYPF
jgi:hypothetical protein